MMQALGERGFGAAGARYEPLRDAAENASFLAIWEDTAVFDFIACLRPPLDMDYVRDCLRGRRHFAAWQRTPAPAGAPPHYALCSTLAGCPHLGLYSGGEACEQRGIWDPAAPEAGRAAWRDALAGLCAHVFSALPEEPYVVLQLRLVVPDAQDEALMLAGWEPFGPEPSYEPQRACYRLLREVHAMYAAP